mgnify:CR=1 FL=1
MLRTLRQSSLTVAVVVVIAVVLALLSVAVLLFAQSRADFVRVQATNALQERIAQAADELNLKLIKAEQLGQTLSALFQDVRGDRVYIERTLNEVLNAVPPEDIFGAGVWYEPYVFEADTRYYGPYVSRLDPLEAPFALTFYWGEPNEANNNYIYYQEPWYVTLLASGRTVVFTEPYLDGGLVFLTAGRAMYDGDTPVGTVSVDLVFPQLQDFINRFNTDPNQIVYVTTAGGATLAYPNAQELLAHTRAFSTHKSNRRLAFERASRASSSVRPPAFLRAML